MCAPVQIRARSRSCWHAFDDQRAFGCGTSWRWSTSEVPEEGLQFGLQWQSRCERQLGRFRLSPRARHPNIERIAEGVRQGDNGCLEPDPNLPSIHVAPAGDIDTDPSTQDAEESALASNDVTHRSDGLRDVDPSPRE